MSAELSVIIVNYNAGQEIIDCVRSVFAADAALEIIVVDNNSHDGSVDKIQRQYHDRQELNIIQNKTNMGFAVACNQGTAAAKGEFYLYLNPDCTVTPETIPVLLQALRYDPAAGMAGGLIVNEDGTEQRGCRRAIPTPWKSLVNSFGLKRLARLNRRVFSDFRMDYEPLPEQAEAVDAISGACMLVKRESFSDVGPMDEGYFLHCEDLDWCMRFNQHGWKILFVPQAMLSHRKGHCSAARPFFVEWSKHKGMVRFYRKFFADQYPAPMFWFVWLGIWLRFSLSVIQIVMRKLFSMVKKSD